MATTASTPTALAVTALHSLAYQAFWKSASVNFSTNSVDAASLQVKLVTSTTAGVATGYANVYMSCSDDGSSFDGNLSAGDAAWTSSSPSVAELSKCFQFLGRISMGSTASSSYTYIKTFFIPVGALPKYAVFLVENQRGTGATLAAAGSAADYTEYKYTSA